jgi:hypothetical protein
MDGTSIRVETLYLNQDVIELFPIMEWRLLRYCFEGQLDIPFRHDNERVLGEAGAEAVRMQTIRMMQGKECKRYWNSFWVRWCGRLWKDSEKAESGDGKITDGIYFGHRLLDY